MEAAEKTCVSDAELDELTIELLAPPMIAGPPRSVLGGTAAAELEALRNDVEEARSLAAEYQRELAGRSNDYAQLKQVFEKTRQHLIGLTATMTHLRQERHALANEAMKVVALERKLEQVTVERDLYKGKLDARDAWAG
jgi:chromosome segregation ATPase